MGVVRPRAYAGRVCVGASGRGAAVRRQVGAQLGAESGRVGLPLGRCGCELLVGETGQNWKRLWEIAQRCQAGRQETAAQ